MKRKLFDPESWPHGRVVLNSYGSPEGELTPFAEAFHLMAKETVAALRKKPYFGHDHVDFHPYPIVFLYRHALELYIKAVILEGAPMLEVRDEGSIDRGRLLRTHSLVGLEQDLERVFKAFKWEWDLGLPHFKSIDDFHRVIADLNDVDAGSYTFRYPMDTKGARALTSPLRFNLFDFCEILDELFLYFDGAIVYAYETLQAEYDAMAEARQYELENSD
jgi:hypothetical protein